MNISSPTVSSSVADIRAGKAKLNNSAQMCSKEVLAGLEPTMFLFVGRPTTTVSNNTITYMFSRPFSISVETSSFLDFLRLK